LLLVEDDATSAKSMKFLLNGRGFDVTVATTLADAVDALASQPSHILIDLMLPDGDGMSLLSAIRAEKLPVWVGVLTGVSDPDRLAAVTKLSPALLLQKPVDLAKLFRALQTS